MKFLRSAATVMAASHLLLGSPIATAGLDSQNQTYPSSQEQTTHFQLERCFEYKPGLSPSSYITFYKETGGEVDHFVVSFVFTDILGISAESATSELIDNLKRNSVSYGKLDPTYSFRTLVVPHAKILAADVNRDGKLDVLKLTGKHNGRRIQSTYYQGLDYLDYLSGSNASISPRRSAGEGEEVPYGVLINGVTFPDDSGRIATLFEIVNEIDDEDCKAMLEGTKLEDVITLKKLVEFDKNAAKEKQ